MQSGADTGGMSRRGHCGGGLSQPPARATTCS